MAHFRQKILYLLVLIATFITLTSSQISGAGTGFSIGSCSGVGTLGGSATESVDTEGASFATGEPIDIPAPLAKIDGIDPQSIIFEEVRSFDTNDGEAINNNKNAEEVASSRASEIMGTVSGHTIAGDEGTLIGAVVNGEFAATTTTTAGGAFSFSLTEDLEDITIALVLFDEGSTPDNEGDISNEIVYVTVGAYDEELGRRPVTVGITNTDLDTDGGLTGAAIQNESITATPDRSSIVFSAVDPDGAARVASLPLSGGDISFLPGQPSNVLKEIQFGINNQLVGLDSVTGKINILDTSGNTTVIDSSGLTPPIDNRHIQVSPAGTWIVTTVATLSGYMPAIVDLVNGFATINLTTTNLNELQVASSTYTWADESPSSSRILFTKTMNDGTYQMQVYDVTNILTNTASPPLTATVNFTSSNFMGSPYVDTDNPTTVAFVCDFGGNGIMNACVNDAGSPVITPIIVDESYNIIKVIYMSDHQHLIVQADFGTPNDITDDAIGVYDPTSDQMNFIVRGFNFIYDTEVIGYLYVDSTGATQVGILNLTNYGY